MERKLNEAAMKGCVISLLNLIHEDEIVLDRYLACCLEETPLHIASLLGHLEFAKEILSRKPQFAEEFDFQRRTPLHLATANGHLEVVKVLLLANPNICLAQDQNGRNPLHIAVIKGRFEVLKELVRAKPEAAQMRGKDGQTILHLCVKHYQLGALKLLMDKINDDSFLNLKDDNGITALQLAVTAKQIESIYILNKGTKVQVYELKENFCTAIDIVSPQNRSNTKSEQNEDSDSSETGERYWKTIKAGKQKKWLEQKRNALMVVASLIATMAFQAGISPPGGFWQDDLQESTMSKSSHIAGHSIMADKYPRRYSFYAIYDTTSFLASISVILLLISGLPFRCRLFMWILMVIMWIATASIFVTFSISICGVSNPDHAINNVLVALCMVECALVAFLLVGHFVRLILKTVRFIRKEGSSQSHNVLMNGSKI